MLKRQVWHHAFDQRLQIGFIDLRASAEENAVDPVDLRANFDLQIFRVEKMVALKKLLEAPASKAGDAIAVTGRVQQVDDQKNTIHLSDVIIRHKDRLSPAVGKELIAEVDPKATFYSYTGGKEPVSLTYIDRDLLQHKDRVLKQEGKNGWAEFLRKKLAQRKAERAASLKEAP